MKKLPKMYKNETGSLSNHNCKSCLVIENSDEVENTLFEIFHNSKHQKVRIKTPKKDYETYLIAKNKKVVTTIENEDIPMDEIIEIEKIK